MSYFQKGDVSLFFRRAAGKPVLSFVDQELTLKYLHILWHFMIEEMHFLPQKATFQQSFPKIHTARFW